MRSLGAVLGTYWFDLLALAFEVETVEEVEVVLLGIGVETDDFRRELAVHITAIGHLLQQFQLYVSMRTISNKRCSSYLGVNDTWMV